MENQITQNYEEDNAITNWLNRVPLDPNMWISLVIWNTPRVAKQPDPPLTRLSYKLTFWIRTNPLSLVARCPRVVYWTRPVSWDAPLCSQCWWWDEGVNLAPHRPMRCMPSRSLPRAIAFGPSYCQRPFLTRWKTPAPVGDWCRAIARETRRPPAQIL